MHLPRRVLLVIGTFCLSVLMYVDRVCISAAKGPVTRDLGLSQREWGWVLSAFAVDESNLLRADDGLPPGGWAVGSGLFRANSSPSAALCWAG